jgi:hypothetical protein
VHDIAMAAKIGQHVADRVAALPRVGQHALVVPVREHGAAVARVVLLGQCLVDPAGGGDQQALHPRRQRVLAVGFGDQVKMVALDREVHDAKIAAGERRAQRAAQRVIDAHAAQVARGLGHASGDEDRLPTGEPRTRFVPLARTIAFLRAAGAFPPTAAKLAVLVGLGQRELLVMVSRSCARPSHAE